MVTISCMDHGSVKACDILFHINPRPQIFAALPLLFFLRKGYALQVESFCCFLLRFLSAFFVAETHETSRIFRRLGWDVRLGLASGLDKGPIPFVGIAQPMVLKKGDPRKKIQAHGLEAW